MKAVEKTAVARILADLIKADHIIDAGEIEFWHNICVEYDLHHDTLVEAQNMSFADAIHTICQSSDSGLKQLLLNDCRTMTLSDGFCAHSEALLMIALTVILSSELPFEGEIYSLPVSNFNIDAATVLYIESLYNSTANSIINENYRSIYKDFLVAGFQFVYIPKVIQHYACTSPEIFKDILSFLAPEMSQSSINDSYKALMEMTTERFCKDLLCNKIGLSCLRSTAPSLLIKIGNSYVGTTQWANYLRLDIDGNLMHTIQAFIDSFTDMLSSDLIVVNPTPNRSSKILFDGFHKQLLDIFLVRCNVRSSILIDPYKEEISFPEIDAKATGLHRREKALYILLLCQGREGLNFDQPKSAANLAKYHQRMDRIQRRYTAIYKALGGESTAVPDLSVPEIRRPIFSCLRRSLKALTTLYNPQDYSVTKAKNGQFCVHVEPELVFVKTLNSSTPTPLLNSPLYAQWQAL